MGGNSQNIKSYLLLDSDLKGSIEFPALYFVDDKLLTSVQKLDLLMMVNGWRSYLWDDIEAVKTEFLDDWNDAGIEIGGYVKKLLWKAPQPNVALTLSSAGGSFTIERTVSDSLGKFSFKRVYLSNITRVMINALTKNGTRNAEIKLNPKLKLDTVINVGSMTNTCSDVELNQNFNRINSFRLMKERDFEPEKGTILLDDVNVYEKRKLKEDSHFRIYSNPDKSLTITNDDLQLKFETGKSNIGFFTSDELADYVVVVEGISKNGKICFGTTKFTVDKK